MRNRELLAALLQPLLLPFAPLFIKLLGAFPALRHYLRVFILCDYRLRSAPLLVNSFLLFLGAALSNVSYFPDLELVVPEVPDVHPYVVMVHGCVVRLLLLAASSFLALDLQVLRTCRS